jgi:hypothetical protein
MTQRLFLRRKVPSRANGRLSCNTRTMELAKKLQLRPEQHLDVVLAPTSLRSTLAPLTETAHSHSATSLLIFVLNRDELEEHRDRIVASALADHLTWVAYPKSGQLGTDLNRDTLSAALTTSTVQPVRQIALDDVWSALRFRPLT